MLAVLKEIGRSLTRATAGPSISLGSGMTASDWATWWGSATGQGLSDAGVPVTRNTALSLPPFWRAVSLIVYGCTKADLRVYERVGQHGKERATDHPAYRLVCVAPNEMMNALTFWRTTLCHAISGGNGYAYIERSRGGRLLGLYLLDPSTTYPVRHEGEVRYVTTYTYGGKLVRELIPRRDILHIYGFGYDGLCGYSPLDICRDSIGGALATRKHATTFFKRGALVSGVLETPNGIDEGTAKATLAAWERTYTGIENAHKIAMLTHGLKFNPMSLDARKSQMLENRQFDRVEIATIMGIPPHKVGDMSRSAYNSLEMEEKAVASDALDPWWRTIEAECNDKLLSDGERASDSHFFEFNRRAAIQTDTEKESQVLEREVNAGLLMPDEARGILNLPELPFNLGKVLLRPKANHEVIDLTKPPADSDDNLDFLRDYTKLLAADGTISDVIFNMTDAQALLEAVNIPAFKGYQEPWLPVIADNGQLVSGEVIKDSEGDVVGGDTLAADPEPEPDEADGDAGEDDSKQVEGETLSRAAHAKRLSRAKRSAKRRTRAQIIAARDAMTDALRHIVTSIKNRAMEPGKRTGVNGNFIEFVESIAFDFNERFDRATGPSARMIAALGGDAGPVKNRFFDEIHAALLLASECKVSELQSRVAWVMELARRACPRLATMAVLSGVKQK